MSQLSASTPRSPPCAYHSYHHCHKVERAIQQIDQKATAVLESLPHFLPTNLILYLKKYVWTASTSRAHPLSTQLPPSMLLPFQSLSSFRNCLPHQAHRGTTSCASIQAEPEQTPRPQGKHHHPGDNVFHHHPGNNVFHSPPSTNPLMRSNFEIISFIPFRWKPKAVLQQTYIQNINPTYEDILLRSDYPRPT